jgi:hypothetical protein
MAEIELSRLSESELASVKEQVLRDLLREASSAVALRPAAGYDKHSSYHSKS